MNREAYKKELLDLLEEDETARFGNPEEAIYEIDGIVIYGGFTEVSSNEFGRTIDHNNLMYEGEVTWEQIIDWGIVIIPETKTYISDQEIEKYKKLGFSNIPVRGNHLVGY